MKFKSTQAMKKALFTAIAVLFILTAKAQMTDSARNSNE
jgi:hypothetical protein